jgi:hypothetical protein
MSDGIETRRAGVPRGLASWKFIAATILLLIISILCLKLVAFAAGTDDAFDLSTTDVTTLNALSRDPLPKQA